MPGEFGSFFWGGGSVPLRVYVLRPPALRAYAATPSAIPVSEVFGRRVSRAWVWGMPLVTGFLGIVG